jgi:hypothetical protein
VIVGEEEVEERICDEEKKLWSLREGEGQGQGEEKTHSEGEIVCDCRRRRSWQKGFVMEKGSFDLREREKKKKKKPHSDGEEKGAKLQNRW